jgi:tetratricopeptide (TPR) repeat protein
MITNYISKNTKNVIAKEERLKQSHTWKDCFRFASLCVAMTDTLVFRGIRKKVFKYGFLSFFLIFFINKVSFSQNETDDQLAGEYFESKEYDKACDLYEKLFNKNQDFVYYMPYLECLVQLKNYKVAEKMVRKQIKMHPIIPQFGVDLGYLYFTEGEEKLAKEQFDQLIKNIQKEEQYVIDLANAFLNRNETDYAIQTYLKARKEMNKSYPFNLELAGIYNAQKDYDKMMDEYVSLLEYSTSYQDQVQNILQEDIAGDNANEKSAALKNVLLRRIQKNPDLSFYSEMLLWYSIQKKDFETAFIQAKSLDRRLKEDGKRVFNLARLASSNKFYDIAISAYQYIIDKGPDNYYYLNSKIEILDTKYLKITGTTTYTKDDLLGLEKDYKSALDEVGKSPASIPLMRNYAHLQAFYLDKSADATKMLYEALDMKAAQPIQLAECKIELADILLMTGEVWEATLLYSQVDKAFKDEPIGSEAKLKNAKLSYYIGEFEWAKAQLDVLKAATSDLTANDAMALSLLISDNLDNDSSYTALTIYARADLLEFRNKYDAAIKTLDTLFIKYKYHSLFDEAYYKKAEIYIKKGLNDSALVYYKRIIAEYPDDILGDDATYNLGVMYEEVYHDKTKAMDTYEKLMAKYPDSIYAEEARRRFRALRGDVVN